MKGEKESKPRLHCLLTGFDRFGDYEDNPSQRIVEMFPDSIIGPAGEITVHKLILETCCERAWEGLSQRLSSADSPPVDILLMLGYSYKATHLHLERTASNVREYRMEDNRGHQWTDMPVEPSAPETLRSLLPLERLCKEMVATGFPAEVSDDAGTFVCNEIYFKALHSAKDRQAPPVSLFSHVPSPALYVASAAKSPPEPSDAESAGEEQARLRAEGEELLRDAVQALVAELSRYCES